MNENATSGSRELGVNGVVPANGDAVVELEDRWHWADLPYLIDQIEVEHELSFGARVDCLKEVMLVIDSVVDTGRYLIEAKRRVPRGKWRRWVRANCTFGVYQARRYMWAVRKMDAIRAKEQNSRYPFKTLRDAMEMLCKMLPPNPRKKRNGYPPPGNATPMNKE
jgi:hypothetical protein